MITLILGKKGSGKTKKLIQLANDAAESSKGNVVVVEKGAKLTYDVSHKARLIDIDEYGIQGFGAFFGFVSGICAGNYDVTDILIDSTLKIGGDDINALTDFVQKINTLSSFASVKLALSVSIDEAELPASLDSVIQKI